MKYLETLPTPSLTPFIHSFWELKGDAADEQWERIFPDGCAGILINLGDTSLTDNGRTKLEPGRTYAVGAMTTYKDNFITQDTRLLGVCLKPGAFSSFYHFAPQSEILDQTVPLEPTHAFNPDKLVKDPIHYLNGYFASRLQSKSNGLEPVIAAIHRAKGRVSISHVAKSHFTTVRQLERKFKLQVGISPKEYANIIRFQHALSAIRDKEEERSLLDIAYECGYYDHSHLANDIKKHTGMIPSQL